MAVGKNKRLTKGGKKGGKKKAGDPFLRKEWYDIKAPSMLLASAFGDPLVMKHIPLPGAKLATDDVPGYKPSLCLH